ncbi:hypothetical protein SAMN04488090_1642 [Siphonobacter aquaeclarae]|uniref:Uncharacterized protein n=1 Tax=Siphonobacter aquaeclarae TaxID=563176 RepID=A0A1G9MM43_9BACT|nr:hypothetical protein [Siphonobacter aquaeclarae]SDL74725.1 hypothetical protein SAMN04488090_1642 [Siphonobacter aquaeclarae]
MQQNSYDLSASSGESGVYIYSFQSIGPKGIILKKIEFIQLHDDSGLLIPFFNLAFGDTDADGSLKDHVVSDNGDMETVLNTVAAAVEDFLIKKPRSQCLRSGADGIQNVALSAQTQEIPFSDNERLLSVGPRGRHMETL